MTEDTSSNDERSGLAGMPVWESWVADAIAAQEQYLKRMRPCLNQSGRSHAPRASGDPATGEGFMVCLVCGVKNPWMPSRP
jgi:hypothetical protein